MFRIGATSCVVSGGIAANVEFLGPRVDDVELVLFDTDDYGENLPDPAAAARLRELAEAHGLTYTVHLPLDLHWGQGLGAADRSLVAARRAVARTKRLQPHAYIAHLDGRGLRDDAGLPLSHSRLGRWRQDACRALELVAGWLDDPSMLCLENLEAWDPESFSPVLDVLPVGRTIDVGHLWLTGVDPVPHIERWLGRARVVHLHGVAGRDHASLDKMSADRLDRVLERLAGEFAGVVTLEVFDPVDLESSLAAVEASLRRIGTARGSEVAS
jgi:sugar phosphate isomerase/epimerase